MYSVSNAFLEKVKEKVQTHRVQGTIGSYSFDKSNIVSGTFHITNQCTDTSDVVLGSVYMGQLECTFTGLNIGYTNWIGKTITPTFGIKLGENTWEDIPLGVYRVIEAEHTAEGVHIVAYDNMRKFDRKFRKSHYQGTKTLLEFVAILCADCNITLGMTEEEFNSLPNTGEYYEMFGLTRKTKAFATDIDTCRDLLFWIAQTMGCFATMNRTGQLVFRKYNSTIVDTISQIYRLTGAEFADYITNYTGIYVNNMRYETESYYGYDAQEIQAEMAIVSGELTIVDDDIQTNRSALVELERKHDAHEITDEEYLAQKAVLDEEYATLTKRRKQLQKHMNWLVKALEKAQAGEDGTSMDLGDNPFLQDENATVRERERRRVLKAIDKISYTPFACSSVMGIHYDLGDVLYFTGGHAGDDGVFCCLMMYDWTFNGGYQMQGFGADPSIANVKTRTQKKAKASNANALAAKELSSGTISPVDSDGKEDDIYIKYKDKTTYEPFYEIEYWGWVDDNRNPNYTYTKPADMATLRNFEWDSANGGYKFEVTGQLYPYVRSNESASIISNGHFGNPVLEIHLPSTGKYKLVCDVSCDIETDKYINQLPAFSEFTQSNDVAGGVPSSSKTFENNTVTRHYEYQYQLTGSSVPSHLYMWFMYWCAYVSMETGVPMNITISGLRLEKIIDEQTGETDGGVSSTTIREIEDIYVKETDPTTGNEVWKAIDYLAGADTSNGLNVNDKIVSLKPEVMRAWFKADPPQVKRTFNQYCVRFTGKPDTDIEITLQNNNGWLNKSIKKDSEGVFTLKSGGTVSSEVIEYCAYMITGLTSGQRYYFNFKANFKDGTTFGRDFTKGLGVVFNTTGVISTDDWEGDPGTFDEENLYCSFRRGTVGTFYDFSFVATASTMYMCVVVADITSGQTSSLTLSRLVISKTEREYVRDFYIFDTVSNDWLPYKPFGSGADSGGDEGASSLGDLDDVNLQSLTNGQTLYYNSATGEWVNGNAYELPTASANVLGGIKVGANLNIDENGVLSATGGGGASAMSDLTDVDIDDQTLDAGQVLKWDAVNEKWVNEDEAGGTTSIELTKAEYDALSSAEKNDPTKVYYVKNYQPVPQGSNMSDLEDVLIDDQTLDEGQVLKWDSVNEQWVNEDESGGTTVIANPTGTPTEQLNTIQIGSDIFEIVGGSGGGNFEVTELWENTTGAGTGEQTLSSSIDGFDLLSIWCGVYAEYTGSPYIIQQCMISVSELNALYSSSKHFVFSGYDNRATYMDFYGDKVNVTNVYNNQRLLKVLGVKCGGGASELADLTDVDLTNIADGQLLRYESSSDKWESVNPYDIVDTYSAHVYNSTYNITGTLDMYLYANGMKRYDLYLSAQTSFPTSVSIMIDDNIPAKYRPSSIGGSVVGQNVEYNREDDYCLTITSELSIKFFSAYGSSTLNHLSNSYM